jgi:hypothetical protein
MSGAGQLRWPHLSTSNENFSSIVSAVRREAKDEGFRVRRD